MPAEDGYALAATLFEPAAAPATGCPITVIAAGAGIPAPLLRAVRRLPGRAGRPALTFDYRDIGGSRRGS